MKNNLILVLSFLFFSIQLNGQVKMLNEFSTPLENQAFNSDDNFSFSSPFGTLDEALNHAFDSISNISTTIGFNAAMRLPDGTVWRRASGIATEDLVPTEMTPDHLQGMGSITKTFVAATIMLMIEDELLTLDDPLDDFIQDFPNVDSTITVRQILNHTSGLNDYLNENQASLNTWATNPDSIWTIEDILNSFVLAPNFEPGIDWSYSNTNYLLAGLVIESLTEEPWYLEVRNRIIDPLNLTHTFSHPFEDFGSQPLANAFSVIDASGNVVDLQANNIPMEGFFSLGTSAGNLITTPEDLVIFMDALHNGDLLSPASLAEIQTNYSPGVGFNYGLGTFEINIGDGLTGWGHNGAIIYQSLAYTIQEKGVTIAVQQNDPFISIGQEEVIDYFSVFSAILDAYCNYQETVDVNTIFDNSISIYPNPTTNQFTIELLEINQQMELTDAAGRKVFEKLLKVGTNNIELPDNIKSGIYFVRIGDQIQKIIVE